MAEGCLRHHTHDRFEMYSAGTSPTEEIHPYSIASMEEVGIDISDSIRRACVTTWVRSSSTTSSSSVPPLTRSAQELLRRGYATCWDL